MRCRHLTRQLVNHVIGGFDTRFYASSSLVGHMSKLCQAEIVQVCQDGIKESLLEGDERIDEGRLSSLCDERISLYSADQQAS